MNELTLRQLLDSVRSQGLSVDQAVAKLRALPFEDLGFAKVDHHRAIRCGFPEVIYSEGKTPEQVVAIFERCAATGGNVMATRASQDVVDRVRQRFPQAEDHREARMVTLRQRPPVAIDGTIAIVSAGTSDRTVAEEARITAEMLDCKTQAFHDVGVAGIHRLLANVQEVQSASVAVVVAGMEGALASVVGGLVDYPVVAVPTSVGYGASFHGLAALLAMLNSCASNVVVVNIDNGFGGGYAAALINRGASRKRL